MIRFSRRIPGDFTLNEWSRRLADARAKGRTLIDLTVSNPTDVGLLYPDVTTLIGSEKDGRYVPEPRGFRSAREAIAAEWGGVSPDSLWLTASTSEAYSILFKLLANPGEEILVPSPSYPLFEALLHLEGVIPTTYPLRYDGTWRLDLNHMESLVTSNVRAIVVVNPNNPTGSYLREEDLVFLGDLCRKREIALISDEVFHAYPLKPGVKATSVCAVPDVFSFTLSGLSKGSGFPQLKLAWIYAAAPAGEFSRLSERLDWISDTYLSVSAPVQNRAAEILRVGVDVRRQIQERIQTNAERLVTMTEGTLIRNRTGEAGWNGIVELPDTMDEEEFLGVLLEKHGVVAYPGHLFDLPFHASIVLSLLPEPAPFERALISAVEVVKSLK